MPFAGTDSVNGQQIGHTGDRRDGMFLILGAQLDGAWLNHVHNSWLNQEFRIKLPGSDAACATENERFATKAAKWTNNLKPNCWKLEYLQSNGTGPKRRLQPHCGLRTRPKLQHRPQDRQDFQCDKQRY